MTYDILDGVRRAKAAQLLGYSDIWAVVADTEDEIRVPLEDLRSPKVQIDVRGDANRRRWDSVLDGMTVDPDLLPAIVVRGGGTGMPIDRVKLLTS